MSVKIVKVVSNKLRPAQKRIVTYLLACGHKVRITMEPHMKPTRKRWPWGCDECGGFQ